MCACCLSSLGVLLKFNRKIIFINRIFTKKKRIEKKQNTNKYCSFQRFRKFPLAWKKLGGGGEKGPPIKKKASPPALMINYITCRCLSACLACCFTFRLSYFLVPYLLAVVLVTALLALMSYCLTNYLL